MDAQGGRYAEDSERDSQEDSRRDRVHSSSVSTGRHAEPRPSSPASIASGHHLSPTAQAFALPNIPAARQSASSLMDAIFGDAVPPVAAHISSPLNVSATPFTSSLSPAKANNAPAPAAPLQFKRKARKGVSRTPSGRSQADTESWDVLSDAGSRMNEEAGSLRGAEGDEVEDVAELQKRGEVVDELQKKVDRRKSQLPQLESELALLEAQIKAAEERLARVQVTQRKEAGFA